MGKKQTVVKVLDHADAIRSEVSSTTSREHKSEFGQFMTPSPVARFMASLFSPTRAHVCRLLDPGAGVGALTCAFLDRWADGELKFRRIESWAYEIDGVLREHLEATLAKYAEHMNLQTTVSGGDFIELGVEMCLSGERPYTHAILNPPYKKINSDSSHRLSLRRAGIETVNLYTAFVAIAVQLLAPGGQLVAIVPRSFCNGPYYKPFRDHVLQRAAIRRMHLFEARNRAFKDDDVLQENIILHLERDAEQGDVAISTSTDSSFSDIELHMHPFDRIVFPEDLERFIHVPTSPEHAELEQSGAVRYSLQEIGVSVSTGPVVDFRLRDHIRKMPEAGTVPLLYPGHFVGFHTKWPNPELKKSNAIALNDATRKWLYPSGFYCVVRRFSSKEERRRVVAGVVDPGELAGADLIGLENHLNVFHEDKHGLPEALAKGLVAFLNTTAVDEYFRRFSGHTQVNATDLRGMKFPKRETLIALGEWVMVQGELSQEDLDEKLKEIIA